MIRSCKGSVVTRKSLYLLLLLLSVGTITTLLILENDSRFRTEKAQLEQSLIDRASILFDMMVHVRSWNAGFHDVFVDDPELEPNPFLADNVLQAEGNRTLIRVNPAWMTRQIAEVASDSGPYRFKITSLHPLNPHNAPDAFEREALAYLNQHRETPHYYRLPTENSTAKTFDFVGALTVKESCLQCHAGQGYITGDIRGGIRISVPLERYYDALNALREHRDMGTFWLLLGALLLVGAWSALILSAQRARERTESLNAELSRRVEERTRKLHDTNAQLAGLTRELEQRVAEELEKNRTNEKLLLLQTKNATMGEMINIIAHQWRQPLSEIAMTANNLIVDAEIGEIDRRSLQFQIERILSQTQHLSATIDDFSNFFKPDHAPESVDIDALCDKAVEMLQKMLQHEQAEIMRSYDCHTPALIYRRELLHVLINLIKNAVDAYQTVDTAMRPITVETRCDDTEAQIVISDYAGGIDPEIIDRIFEPYFTTKSEHNGSGLGLYIVRIIVEHHLHGTIEVQNSRNGARFTLSFPLHPPLKDTHA